MSMTAFIRVVDTPWAAKTGTDGDVLLRAIPAGGATLRVWHPRLAVRGNETAQTLTIGAAPARRTFSGDFTGRAPVR